jgi:hypothetical protein
MEEQTPNRTTIIYGNKPIALGHAVVPVMLLAIGLTFGVLALAGEWIFWFACVLCMFGAASQYKLFQSAVAVVIKNRPTLIADFDGLQLNYSGSPIAEKIPWLDIDYIQTIYMPAGRWQIKTICIFLKNPSKYMASRPLAERITGSLYYSGDINVYEGIIDSVDNTIEKLKQFPVDIVTVD